MHARVWLHKVRREAVLHRILGRAPWFDEAEQIVPPASPTPRSGMRFSRSLPRSRPGLNLVTRLCLVTHYTEALPPGVTVTGLGHGRLRLKGGGASKPCVPRQSLGTRGRRREAVCRLPALESRQARSGLAGLPVALVLLPSLRSIGRIRRALGRAQSNTCRAARGIANPGSQAGPTS